VRGGRGIRAGDCPTFPFRLQVNSPALLLFLCEDYPPRPLSSLSFFRRRSWRLFVALCRRKSHTCRFLFWNPISWAVASLFCSRPPPSRENAARPSDREVRPWDASSPLWPPRFVGCFGSPSISPVRRCRRRRSLGFQVPVLSLLRSPLPGSSAPGDASPRPAVMSDSLHATGPAPCLVASCWHFILFSVHV